MKLEGRKTKKRDIYDKVTMGATGLSPFGDYVEYLELCHREARKLGYLSTNS